MAFVISLRFSARRYTRLAWSVFLALTICGQSFAQDFLNDARNMFFDSTMHSRRFGIEVEFSGLPDKTIEQIVIEKLQATVTERSPSGDIIFATPYGIVKIKIEGQAWRYETDPEKFAIQTQIDLVQAPREIVFPPMTYKDVDAIQSVFDALRDHGAIGTTPTNAVSTQVNVEMKQLVRPDGTEDRKAVQSFLDLMRVYSHRPHSEQLQQRIDVPAIRREYIRDYSPGFLRKLNNPRYQPTARELYDDFLYRQSLEVLGFQNAWTLEIHKARKLLLDQPDPVVPQVVKMLRLRVSSHLLEAFPEDPLTKAIIATRWARPMPISEFREPNTDWNVKTTIEQTLGIVRSAEVFGEYDHDTLVSRLTGIDPRDLAELRKFNKLSSDQVRVVRYILQDPKSKYLKNQNPIDFDPAKDSLWIQLDPSRIAQRPLIVDGESVVYNRRHIHRKTLLGKYNPGLENALIQQVMENKIFEAKLLKKYARTSMARTMTLQEIAGHDTVKIKDLLALLQAEFPNGWVMKGAWDLSTEQMFISDKLEVEKLIGYYYEGFEAFKAKTEKEMPGADPEAVIDVLKQHAGYRGWRILQMLSHPEQVFFQERLRIVKEFRVEVQGGKILSAGSTIDRYAYSDESKAPSSKAELEAAEKFAQKILYQLPEALRYLPYGFDVALLENGTWKMIETNPGGNSSFLDENKASLHALNAYLRDYPRLIKEGKIKLLSAPEQIVWIMKHFKEFGIEPGEHYRGYEFQSDDIIDHEYKKMKLPRSVCERLLAA